MKKEYRKFINDVGGFDIKTNEPLAEYTTVGIGGLADILCVVSNSQDLERLGLAARKAGIPVTVIGGGSNILVADRGLRGLVIINTSGGYSVGGCVGGDVGEDADQAKPEVRWGLDGTTVRYHFSDLDYDESGCSRIEVLVDSGVQLQGFMYEMIKEGITGLQWYSGIPGTVGGAVFNNLHGGTHFFSEVVNFVEVLTEDGDVKKITVEEIQPGYNRTVFHTRRDIILRARLNLYQGDAKKAKYVADEWRKRKHKVQPQKSIGCIFANISQEDRERLDLPTTSVGHIVEHVLGMSGYRIGKAFISPKHHNFIETSEGALAKDYLKIIKDITHRASKELDLKLVIEILLFGFTNKEFDGIYRPGVYETN